MSRKLTPASSLRTLRKEAKRWLKALRAGDAGARVRLEKAYPAAPPDPVLRDVQHALAREVGLDSWKALQAALARPSDTTGSSTDWPVRSNEDYERLAIDFVRAFNERDDAALQRLNEQYGRAFGFDDLWAEVWRRVYAFRQRAFRGSGNQSLELDEARGVIAQDAGFGSWRALLEATEKGAQRVPAFVIDTKDKRIAPHRQLGDVEWDELMAAARDHGITALAANGLMSDAVMERVASLTQVTRLSLGGSRQLGDDGLLHLAKMPQLRELELSEYPGGRITDRGLEVLARLPELRAFEMTWQRGISDRGAARLRHCEHLESVNLMGSPTGDGAIAALAGKPKLRRFSTGRQVTDAGLKGLRELPLLRRWYGGDPRTDSPDTIDQRAAHLLVDGPFTNRGLASLAALEGVCSLDLFWHCTGITSDGFAHLAHMPHLLMFAADGALSDDTAMGHIATMPSLRALRAQEATATDAGFEALGRSQTLERFWGRECPNFGSHGFVALSRMPRLQSLGIGCKNVDNAALAALPAFPALRELTPIGFTDDGFRHIGRCEKLERLTCMYCRETGDTATEHIADLRLKYYYAGLTQITDRSLQILGRMESLEQIDLYECNGLTDAGLTYLALLPNLREVNLDALQGVTFAGTRVFPEHVRVRYST